MKKLEYEAPAVNFVVISVQDIITTSGDDGIVLPDDEWE